MKLLMTTDTVGGVWTYAMELARALLAYPVEITLATMGAPLSEDQRAQASAIPNLHLRESTFRLEWMQDPWDDVRRAGHWLLEIEQQLRPDLIHLNGYSHGALPFAAPAVVVAHSCVCSWFQAVHGVPAPSTFDRYRREVAMGVEGADVVVAPTQAMLNAVIRYYGAQPGMRVIPNARQPAFFTPRHKQPLILSAGRLWDEAKNLAALDVIADRVPWPIHVAGPLKDPDGRSSTPRAVRCLGRLAEHQLAEEMSRAAIYALPARYEPFGLSILEAALSGCVLVLGDIPSLRELWNDAATFVRPEDPEHLLAAINCLISDPALRHQLASRALARAADFHPRQMAAAYTALYGSLIDRQRRLHRSAVLAEPIPGYWYVPVPLR